MRGITPFHKIDALLRSPATFRNESREELLKPGRLSSMNAAESGSERTRVPGPFACALRASVLQETCTKGAACAPSAWSRSAPPGPDHSLSELHWRTSPTWGRFHYWVCESHVTAAWPSLHCCRHYARSPEEKSAELLCAEQEVDAYYTFPLPTPEPCSRAEIERCRVCEQGCD